MGQVSQNGLHLKKCVTLLRICHTSENRSHYKNGSYGEKWVTWGNRSHFEKWVKFGKKIGHTGKMGHIWENGSHLGKWVKILEMGHT